MKKSIFIFILIALFIPRAFTHADITTGLVAWWKLTEGSGTTAIDSSGNGYTGTLLNGPVYVTGNIWPYALNTDVNVTGNGGSEVHVSDVPTGSTWTISAWAKFPLSANGSWRTLTRSSTTGNDHHILVNPSGYLGMYDNDTGSAMNDCINGGVSYNVSSV